MKITAQHYVELSAIIGAFLARADLNGELVASYTSGEFPRADKVKDLQLRFCFDVLYMSGANSFACSELYSYLDDTHIYTALRSLCPTIPTENYTNR